MDLISIIIPVYNVQTYLNRCVESIVNQTYRNLEIILVDDGSPDECPRLCDQWANADDRIRVIHKKNGGLSDARNAGIKIAKGKYIAFLDSDDWVDLHMYEDLYKAMVEYDADIVSCGALRVWEDHTPSKPMHSFSGIQVMNRSQAMQALIQSTFLIQTVWNKLYKTEQIKDIYFEMGKIHEDEYWSWQVIARASKVVSLDRNYYFYLQRSSGIMGNGYTGRGIYVIEAKNQRHAFVLQQFPELSDLDSLDLIYTCYYHWCQILKFETSNKKQYLTQIKKVLSNCKISKQYSGKMTLMQRVRVFLIKNCTLLMSMTDLILKRG